MRAPHLQMIFLTLGVNVFAGPNSSLKARIYYSAFKFFSENAHHVVSLFGLVDFLLASHKSNSLKLNLMVPRIVLPNMTRIFSAGYGSGKVSLHGMNITEFQSPK